jgi:hypothetical protein
VHDSTSQTGSAYANFPQPLSAARLIGDEDEDEDEDEDGKVVPSRLSIRDTP